MILIYSMMKSIPNSGFSASRVLALIGVTTAFDGNPFCAPILKAKEGSKQPESLVW